MNSKYEFSKWWKIHYEKRGLSSSQHFMLSMEINRNAQVKVLVIRISQNESEKYHFVRWICFWTLRHTKLDNKHSCVDENVLVKWRNNGQNRTDCTVCTQIIMNLKKKMVCDLDRRWPIRNIHSKYTIRTFASIISYCSLECRSVRVFTSRSIFYHFYDFIWQKCVFNNFCSFYRC